MNRSFHNIMEQLNIFCKRHSVLYLYGAGNYGRICKKFLEDKGIYIRGFIVTHREKSICEGVPIYEVSAIPVRNRNNEGIILSLSEKHQSEIQSFLESNDLENFPLPDGFFDMLPYASILAGFEESPVQEFSSMSAWKKILVIRLDVIGDMVWTTAFLRELKRNCPNGEISLVMRDWVFPLIKECPYVDHFIQYDKTLPIMEIQDEMNHLEVIKKRTNEFANRYLKVENYDVVLLPTGIFRGNNSVEELLLALHSGAKERIGRVHKDDKMYQSIFKTAFSKLSVFENKHHEVVEILGVLKNCGADIVCDSMELWVGKEEECFAQAYLNKLCVTENQSLIAVGLVGRMPARTWDCGNYKLLIHEMRKKYGDKIKFVLFGGKEVSNVAAYLEGANKNAVINLAGKTSLSQLVAFVEKCCMYVGSNTGIMHIAAALKKPIVEIVPIFEDGTDICHKDWARMGAWRVEHEVVTPAQGIDECFGKGQCIKPYAHCINQITVDAVFDAVEFMMKKYPCCGRIGQE